MKTVILFLGAFAFQQAIGFAGIETAIPETNRVILELGDWVPTQDETRKALIAIGDSLNGPELRIFEGQEKRKILRNIKNYRVQFVGTKRQGRKIIWCNFFPADRGEKDQFENWRREKIEVDDGGFWFWHIDYDPSTGKCENFESNGYA